MNNSRLVDIIYSLSDKCFQHRKSHLKQLGLSRAEFKGLVCVDKDNIITCKEFSMRMGLSVSRGSRVIDKLHQKNHILRTSSPSDRRCKMIQLTKKGQKTRARIDKEKDKCEQKLTSEMSGLQINQLKKDLLSLIDKL
ncbi:MAG: MarR family transcriptional regulator [Candidatus Aminicenantes bacterium]|nr:MarR family transcriptional regulator [Candidatus Aminicenantes bacterium]